MVGPQTILSAINVPSSWRFALVTLAAMLALAGLDFIGSIFAKEWAERGHSVLLIGGLVSFSALFVVYARILQVAELSVVTFGWVVFLQVGILLLDRIRYDVHLPPSKWVAVAAILALQAYLILGPSGSEPRRLPSTAPKGTLAPQRGPSRSMRPYEATAPRSRTQAVS